jgi:branched-chain amino acid transport system ATP-binding protein
LTTLLATSGLSKHFGGNRALGPVDFHANSGEIVGLIGPNGSGKTTFFNCVTGFHKPSGGRVEWRGANVTGFSPGRLAGLGLIRTFQEKMVFSGLSVRENVTFALIQHGVRDIDESAIRGALTYVGLREDITDQKAGDLPWGQCRLLGIAMALVLKPTLLLLDEPFAGTNRVAAEHVTATLRRLKADGIGAVIVEHEMSLLLPNCDRVVVFAAGEVLAEGTSEEIVNKPEVRAAYFGAETLARD